MDRAGAILNRMALEGLSVQRTEYKEKAIQLKMCGKSILG